MEPLAFVEVIGRNGDVSARHPVYRWPARAGRAYDCDVILDDRYVAPRHVEINDAGDGTFSVTDLQSINGIAVLPSHSRVPAANVGPDSVVRLGRTEIRIRHASYQVAPEVQLRAAGFYRNPWAFAGAAASLLLAVAWTAWIMTTEREEVGAIVFPVLMVMVLAGLWMSVWSLVGKTVGGRANFAAHGFITCAGVLAALVAGTLFEYVSFALNADWIETLGAILLAGITAYVIYRQLRLNSRAARTRLAAVATLVVAAVYGLAFAVDLATESSQLGRQSYNGVIKPPAILLVQGTPAGMFLASGEKLKSKVDRLAGKN